MSSIRVGLFPLSEKLAQRVVSIIETLAGWEVRRCTENDIANSNLATCDLIALAGGRAENTYLNYLAHLSQVTEAPVIAIAKLAEPQDIAAVLRAGADDFIAHPFAAEELLARMENLVVRSRGLLHPDQAPACIQLDRVGRIITVDDARASLSVREWSVFLALLEHVGKPVSLEQLAQQDSFANASRSAVVTSVSRLRRRLGEIPGINVATVPRSGYVLEGPALCRHPDSKQMVC